MIQAILAKSESNCLTRQIGAVLVKNNRQISTGYNGIPRESLIVLKGDAKDALRGLTVLLNQGNFLKGVYVFMRKQMP